MIYFIKENKWIIFTQGFYHLFHKFKIIHTDVNSLLNSIISQPYSNVIFYFHIGTLLHCEVSDAFIAFVFCPLMLYSLTNGMFSIYVKPKFLFCNSDYPKHNLKIRCFLNIFSIAFIKYIYMVLEIHNLSRNGIKDRVCTVLIDRHP